MKDTKKFTLTLFLICAIAGGLLAFVDMLTKPKILAQVKVEEGLGLKEVMPGAVDFEEVSASAQGRCASGAKGSAASGGKKDGEVDYFKARDSDKRIIGYCFLAKKHGYSSDIVTMVGIRPDGEITGIKILEQNETPGLGTKISEHSFQAQFKAKDASDPRVDAITGATISSKAVIDSIKEKAKEILRQSSG